MAVVGFLSGREEDATRRNWSGDSARPLRWSAWYPTDVDAAHAEPVSTDKLYILGKTIAGLKISARRKTYPAVLLSHGTGGTAAGLGWLAERLAEAGFLVIGADHHGNTAGEPYRAEGFLCWWERAADLSALLDHHAIAGPFAGRIDLDRVTVAGFSLGGYTALSLLGGITHVPLYVEWAGAEHFATGPREFPDIVRHIPDLLEDNPVFRTSWERQSISFNDPRIKAAFLCAPAPTVRGMTKESLERIKTPVAMAATCSDREAPADLCAQWLHEVLPDSRLEILDHAAGHYVFLSECTDWGRCDHSEICVDPPGISRRDIHDRSAALAVGFFGLATLQV
ncbi:hypothetical protein GAO09_19935 [Rhizobiales bacterium RZME27]|uniref:Serine aminopeptidase S33 domain-containing protein n=1 Tax=Endobacterium cereale TaxID=2663029 RepID=A0A6A8AEU6_9HYPH|nr:alpha/beta hydrolase [Endobacterium cereale]MEB2846096.1 alpha/beta hydrolase [Endobacterium cereale]MQY48307.1 hypothetical protein [Endobacterium cereale]